MPVLSGVMSTRDLLFRRRWTNPPLDSQSFSSNFQAAELELSVCRRKDLSLGNADFLMHSVRNLWFESAQYTIYDERTPFSLFG
jgi:hypothetical protein